MKVNEIVKARRKTILLYLQQHGRSSVDDLATEFETTPQTIRKDLAALSNDNKVMRFHGSVSLLVGSKYAKFDLRKEVEPVEKKKIGVATAEQIPNNAVIFINAGTTTTAVARCLKGHTGLILVTDSVSLADTIRGFTGVEVYVPGGKVRSSDGVIMGGAAVEFIRQFRADIAVVGAAAIARDGTLLDFDLREAQIARTFIENANNVILAVDSTKFDRLAPVSIGHMKHVQTLVTGSGCPTALRQLCKTHDVGLVEAL